MTKEQRIQKATDIARACAESDEAVKKIRAEIDALSPKDKAMIRAIRAVQREAAIRRRLAAAS